MNKNILRAAIVAPVLALALSGCIYVVRDPNYSAPRPTPNPAPVSGSTTVVYGGSNTNGNTSTSAGISITIRFGLPVSTYITDFAPTRGAGSFYSVARRDQVQFRLGANRNGYVTLAIYNPNDPSCSSPNYIELSNIPVEVGNNIIPRNAPLYVDKPYGTSVIRAYFTTTPGPSSIYQNCFTRNRFESRLQDYFGPYSQEIRDVAETSLNVVR